MTTAEDIPRARFARTYLRVSKTAERRGGTQHRQRLLAGLEGRVVEVGAGHGLNFPHYPSAVTEVVAIEPEPTLRGVAERVATTATVHVIRNCQPKRALLRIADHSGLWPRIAGGCHPARDTTAAIQDAGFEISASERTMFAPSRFEPSIPFVIGVAQKRQG